MRHLFHIWALKGHKVKVKGISEVVFKSTVLGLVD